MNENLAFEEIFLFLRNHLELTQQDETDIFTNFEYQYVQKNTALVAAGEIAQYLYFTASGFLQICIEKDGEEFTTQINCPSRFITLFPSFYSQSPAFETLKSISNAHLLKISKSGFERIFYQDDRWTKAATHLYNLGHNYNEERANDMLTLSAREKYLKLMNTRPEILQFVPSKIVASFLGLHPQSLSRVKKNLL